MNLYAKLIKLLWGIDLQCDFCKRTFKTERGRNIHRASHKRYYDPLEGYNVKQFLGKVVEK